MVDKIHVARMLAELPPSELDGAILWLERAVSADRDAASSGPGALPQILPEQVQGGPIKG